MQRNNSKENLVCVISNEKSLIEAGEFIKYLAKCKGIKNYKIPRNCIITFFPELVEKAIKKFKGKKSKNWAGMNGTLYEFNLGKNKIGLIGFGFGGAAVTVLIEQLIASGGKSFVVLGAVGGISDLEVGEIVGIKDSLRGEGTSFQYLKKGKKVEAGKKLLDKAKKKIKLVRSWTTDAPYRETISKIRVARKENAKCVEMEAASIYAVAKFRKIEALVVGFVSDVITDSWEPNWMNKTVVGKAKKELLDIGVSLLKYA